MAIRPSRASVVALIVAIAAAEASAQTADPCLAPVTNPPDVSLTLSLQNSQSVFREGETIGLALSFSSSATSKYVRDTRSYDRSGRMMSEVFCLQPTAGRDPLDDYFRSGLSGGFLGGGLGASEPLTAAASTVQIELNEWHVLPPGTYRLRLRSGRIERAAGVGEPGSGIVQVPLWSNEVAFEVIPATPEWQATRLAAAIAAIDSGKDDATRRDGARSLRFLGSEPATRELARRFTALNAQPFGWEFMFGLIASPHRQTAINAMRAAIVDPSRAITREFIETLALLEIQAHPDDRLPAYDERDREAWMKLRERKAEAYKRAIAGHFAELSAAMDAKTGEARAVAANLLMSLSAGTADTARARAVLVASWDSLPLRTRNELLEGRWNEIAGPDVLPILRRIIASPVPRGRPPDQPDRGAALSRLYELAPAEGRELMLREMVNPQSGVSFRTLGRLPDRELPQIEAPILARLNAGNGWDTDFQLLDRYGTAAAFAELQRIYARSRGRWACTPQTAMLRYFLRVDREYGVAQVADALGHREVTGCYQTLFGFLGEALVTPGVEPLATAALDDPSAEVGRNAAEALGRHGSAEAEPALWSRLRKFHDAWKDRYDELRPSPIFDRARSEQGSLEYALVQAIACGEAWISDADDLEKLRSVSSPPRQNDLSGSRAAWQSGQFNLSVNWYGDGRLFYDVAQYSGDSIERLIRKLRQFPKGSRFEWRLQSVVADRHRDEIESVERAARSAGLVLEIRKF